MGHAVANREAPTIGDVLGHSRVDGAEPGADAERGVHVDRGAGSGDGGQRAGSGGERRSAVATLGARVDWRCADRPRFSALPSVLLASGSITNTSIA